MVTKPNISPSSTMDALPFVKDAAPGDELPHVEAALHPAKLGVDEKTTRATAAGDAPTAADLEAAMLHRADTAHGPWAHDALIGVLGGFLSVMTATGGAFMTIPMLLLADRSLPPTHAVSLGQAISLPITTCTALVAALSPLATLDIALAATIGAAVTLGVPAGVRLARRAKPAYLKLGIALCLLAGGATALDKTIHAAHEEFQ